MAKSFRISLFLFISLLTFYGDIHAYVQPIDVTLEAIAEIIDGMESKDEADLFDNVREFVFRNSIHLIDDTYSTNANNPDLVLYMLLSHYRFAEEPPHLCGGLRNMLLKTILEFMGKRCRKVVIFSDEYYEFRSHTITEVFNSQTQTWEVHDADFDVCFINKNTNKRANIMQLVFEDFSNLVPVNKHGLRGWKENGVNHLQWYYKAFLADNIFMINYLRCDLDKSFPHEDQKTFLELVKHYYPQAKIIIR